MKKSRWKGEVEDCGSTIDLVDSENQLLQFRVGEVFFGKSKSQTETGLWIWYQERYLDSKESGPVLMDEENWKKIRNYIDKKFRRSKNE
jgi:hypothetical protein